MKTIPLLENWIFNDKTPHAEPIFVSHDSRILRFTLRPNQIVREHNAPHSPVYIVVLKGRGMFAGADGIEKQLSPETLIVYEAGEDHLIRALDEDLVFLTILHGAPGPH